MKNKVVKILSTVLLVIAGLFVLVFIGANIYFKFPVRDYYSYSKKAFRIPGICKGFVAQGISYDESENNFYITGYMKNHSASPIYIVNKDSKKLVNTVFMANMDNSPLNCHAGGLSVYNGTIYIAGGEEFCLYKFNQAEVRNAPKKSSVICKGIVDLSSDNDGIGVAFTTVKDNMLFAGEFHREPNYPTYDSHKVITSSGENKGLMVGLEKIGNDFIPSLAYSIPDLVQGACFEGGKLYLSTSYATPSSHIYVYDESKIKQQGTINCLGKDIPLFVLDNTSLCDDKKIAPMSEEIVCVDDEFYIMCESASNKYIFGKFIGAQWCYKSKF